MSPNIILYLAIIVLIALYFLPSIIAQVRGHANAVPIYVLNVFLGWTVVMWVVCLAWAFAHDLKEAE